MLMLLRLEVMDKEPRLAVVVVLSLLLGAAGFALARRHPLTSVPSLLVLLVGILAVTEELRDPAVGPAIRSEAGAIYAPVAVGALCSAALMVLRGAMAGIGRRSARSATADGPAGR